MTSMTAIISRHNKIILFNRITANSTMTPCNCKNKVSCPSEVRCCESSIIYKACLILGKATYIYYGFCETEFKARFHNHKQSFKYRRKSNATELSKAFWQAKDAGKNPCIKWSIASHTAPYQPGAKSYNLCLTDELTILQADSNSTLNKRTELNKKCRHSNKFKLSNFC